MENATAMTARSILHVRDALPPGFARLAVEAAAEGFRHVDRLAEEWRNGSQRFTRAGERLLAVVAEGDLAAIGGLTVDPVLTPALRMRRFYVRPGFRRQEIGRALAQALIAEAPAAVPITVHAGTAEAPAFWVAMGFAPHAADGHTHILARSC
jgi:GNAT superfamily N-acetyltransferase